MIKTEPVTKEQVNAIRRALGIGAILMDWDIDYEIGRGLLGGIDRCLWSKKGFRITILIDWTGLLLASQGNDPDPVYAKLREKLNDE